jgi:hypothetical protein
MNCKYKNQSVSVSNEVTFERSCKIGKALSETSELALLKCAYCFEW